MRSVFLISLLVLAPLCGEPSRELELTVHLQTEEKRLPLFLHVDPSCPTAAREALLFDLHHGGYLAPATVAADASKTLQGDLSSPHVLRHASKSGVAYLTSLQPTPDGQWVLEGVSVRDGRAWKTHPCPMPMDPLEQRRWVHMRTDALHKEFFQRPPIATRRILYTISPQSDGATEIWEMDYDGQGRRKITGDAHVCFSPIYLPAQAGQRPEGILYVSYRAGVPKLFMITAPGRAPQRISELAGNQFHPGLSAQQDRIAFVSDAAGRPDLFIQSFCPKRGGIGQARQLYTAPHSGQASPTWSPDGARIAFVSDKDKGQRIYIVEIPPLGTRIQEIQPTCITKTHLENTAPSWSPNGRYLAYCAKVSGVRQIWVYDFETGRERALTSGPHHKENPCWAPDSLHLVFNTATSSQSELFLANLNEASAQRITQGKGIKRFPFWERTQ